MVTSGVNMGLAQIGGAHRTNGEVVITGNPVLALRLILGSFGFQTLLL